MAEDVSILLAYYIRLQAKREMNNVFNTLQDSTHIMEFHIMEFIPTRKKSK